MSRPPPHTRAQDIDACRAHWQRHRRPEALRPLRAPRAGAGKAHAGTAAARWEAMEAGARGWRRSLGDRAGLGWVRRALYSADRVARALPPWARWVWLAADVGAFAVIAYGFTSFGPGRHAARRARRAAGALLGCCCCGRLWLAPRRQQQQAQARWGGGSGGAGGAAVGSVKDKGG